MHAIAVKQAEDDRQAFDATLSSILEEQKTASEDAAKAEIERLTSGKEAKWAEEAKVKAGKWQWKLYTKAC